jgi:membrane fusion protein (multidrug efflux system)
MRYVVAIAALLLLVGGLAAVKYKQIAGLMQAGKQMQKAGPPPEAVGTAVARQETWEGTLSSVGTVTAARGVAISNEVPGTVGAIRFESGNVVRAGQVLVELDTSVERAQLASLEARKELAARNVGRSRMLAQGDGIPAAQLDGDEAQLKSSTADAAALQAQIERKTLRAPFAGRLGIRTVNLGQYLNPGTPVTVLEALGSVYVDFSLPQQYLGSVSPGTAVRAGIAGERGASFTGVVAAIDPALDPASRTIKLRASVPNRGDKLRPGMFVTVEVVLGQGNRVVAIPVTAVVHASYGDSVFVVEDKKDEGGAPVRDDKGEVAKVARQQFVRLGDARGDFVAIADGVTAGQEVVSAGAFKLRNGTRIRINNSVQPPPSLVPHPENR